VPVARRVLFALPDSDFDPTEVAVPWSILLHSGHDVVFASESGGQLPRADALTLEGPLPKGLLISPEAKERYQELQASPAFQKPISWSEIDPQRYDAVVLPGGHAPGMRPYLESEVLHQKLAEFWKSGRLVGAICHGVLTLARTRRADGKSVLFERRTTGLTKTMELGAHALTFLKHGRHYRTYEAFLEDEVKELLADPSQFERGPLVLSSVPKPERGFVMEDGNYLSARFPGDAWVFGRKLAERLAAQS
jgi:putative intracellular protease/amidase